MNAQDYIVIRKLGKPLMNFKARLSHSISIWLLFFGRLEDSCYEAMFLVNFLPFSMHQCYFFLIYVCF